MTKIEWADESWNIFYGCRRKSAGCGRGREGGCYAERMMPRLGGYELGVVKKTPRGPRFTGKVVYLDEERLTKPLRWRKPRRVFVESMADLFYEGVDEDFIDAAFRVMAECHRRGLGHVFIILTKRAERMASYMRTRERAQRVGAPLATCGTYHLWPLPNVVMMVSAELQAEADERIPLLLQTPAVCRGVSYEPMLGPVDFSRWLRPRTVSGRMTVPPRRKPASPVLDWIIAGDESGPNRRTARMDWVRSVRDQIAAAPARCALFFKQFHENGKKVSTPCLDGEQHIAEPAIFDLLGAA